MIPRALSLFCILSTAIWSTGCQSLTAKWPTPVITYTHAATPAQAHARAVEWVRSQPGRSWSPAATTGSMRPHIVGGPREYLLDEVYTEQPLSLGHLVVFHRDTTTPRCLHMIAALRGDWFYISGTNNRWSDGWFHRSTISHIVREVVTLPAEGTR